MSLLDLRAVRLAVEMTKVALTASLPAIPHKASATEITPAGQKALTVVAAFPPVGSQVGTYVEVNVNGFPSASPLREWIVESRPTLESTAHSGILRIRADKSLEILDASYDVIIFQNDTGLSRDGLSPRHFFYITENTLASFQTSSPAVSKSESNEAASSNTQKGTHTRITVNGRFVYIPEGTTPKIYAAFPVVGVPGGFIYQQVNVEREVARAKQFVIR